MPEEPQVEGATPSGGFLKMKEEYNKLKKQFGLPDFDKLNNEFEISTIEEEEFLIRAIRKKIHDKISDFLKSIDPILQPETIVSDMQESNYFEETDRNDILYLYKSLKILDKKILELVVIEDDKETAKFISHVMSIWPDIKKQMREVAIKLQKAWGKEISTKDETGYLG